MIDSTIVKVRWLVLTAMGFVLSSCVSSTIVPFAQPNTPHTNLAPTVPQMVGIYRTRGPFASFSELGLISFRASFFDLQGIYNQLRQDSSLQGADAVVDLKITSETHEETEWIQQCTTVTTSCDPNGICQTEQQCTPQAVTKEVTTFLATGTMIKNRPGSLQ